MAVQLNHTIVEVRDKHESATFVTDLLGLRAPTTVGPFLVVGVDNGVSLDFYEVQGDIHPQHYAFLVSEGEFDEIFGRISQRWKRSTARSSKAPSAGTRFATC